MMLIPAIDLLDGEVVRLYQGDYQLRTRYSRVPADIASEYHAAGAELLHLVDLNAARRDTEDNMELVRSIVANAPLPVQTGGGVRNEERMLALFDAGVERVVIGSLAVQDPARVLRWLNAFDPAQLVLALDVRINDQGEPQLLTEGWQEEGSGQFWPLLEQYAGAGLVHLLCTDISRDGTLAGSNVALYSEILRRFPRLQLQASGGIGSVADIEAIQHAGVPAVILGRALLEGRFTLEEAAAAVKARQESD